MSNCQGIPRKDDFVLRRMVRDDIAAVAGIERECFSDAWSERLLEEMLENRFDEVWVIANSDGLLSAYANFRFLVGEGELMRIAVRPDCRGRGYGRILMERLELSSRENQISDLTLEVRAGNEAAIRLYESCGFQTEAVRRGYYTRPQEDAKIMWRRRA